jgi:predicted nucleic acid-binding protein
MILVIDASPIIAFYSENELNEPELLHTFAKNNCQLVIPEAVYSEIKRGRKPTFSTLSKAIREGVISINNEITVEETIRFGKRYPRLHDGELQVLLLGLKLRTDNAVQYYCVIDEDPARKVALRHNIPVKGTKGLINVLNKIGVINEQRRKNLLYRLDHCNFRLK